MRADVLKDSRTPSNRSGRNPEARGTPGGPRYYMHSRILVHSAIPAVAALHCFGGDTARAEVCDKIGEGLGAASPILLLSLFALSFCLLAVWRPWVGLLGLLVLLFVALTSIAGSDPGLERLARSEGCGDAYARAGFPGALATVHAAIVAAAAWIGHRRVGRARRTVATTSTRDRNQRPH